MKQLIIILAVFSFALTAAPVQAQGLEKIFYYFPSSAAYESVEKNYRDIDILAPQIYSLIYSQELGIVENTKILELAEDKNIDVMPLVVNINNDKALTSRFLKNDDAQEKFIEDLIDEAQDRDFIGWQLDFENINHLDRSRYADFVKDAYEEFQKEDLLLSVAVIPRTTPYNPNSTNQDWSSGYDVKQLSRHSDFVTLMTYDDPRSSGPVASMNYVNDVLDHNLGLVDEDKISLGIPMYCWQYEYPSMQKIANVPYPLMKNTLSKYPISLSTYINEYEAEIFLFIKNGMINIGWCDNAQSYQAKESLADTLGFRGVSYWALGHEAPSFWE